MGDIISDYGLWDGKFFITNVDKSNTNIEPDEIHIDQEILKVCGWFTTVQGQRRSSKSWEFCTMKPASYKSNRSSKVYV